MRLRIDIDLKLEVHEGDSNHHGTQAPGEPWNGETITGPRLRFVDVQKDNKRHSFYWRWIFYFPSGACRYFDLYRPVKS